MIAQTQLDIARVFAVVACDLATQPDFEAVSRRVSTVAATVMGCPWAQAVKLTDRGTLTFPEPSDPVLRAALLISAHEHEGIVAEAVTGQGNVVVDDFAVESRWPDYCARIMAETPIRSAMALLLRLGDRDLGAIAMYSPETAYFTDARCLVGSVLAAHAAIAMANATNFDRVTNLEIALTTNRRIGIAIGVLMARLNVTDEQAFDLLRRTSQHMHVKLRDVADYVATAGELPLDGFASETRRTETTGVTAGLIAAL